MPVLPDKKTRFGDESAYQMLVGGLICLAGMAIALWWIRAPSPAGGAFVLPLAAIVFGGVHFLRGLEGRSKKPPEAVGNALESSDVAVRDGDDGEDNAEALRRQLSQDLDAFAAPPKRRRAGLGELRRQLPQDLDVFAAPPKPSRAGLLIVTIVLILSTVLYLLFLR